MVLAAWTANMRKAVKVICKNCSVEFISRRKISTYCTRKCSGLRSHDNIKKKRKSFIEKFCLVLNESLVKNSCWIWAKGKDRKGYGQFHFGKHGTYKAHRVSYEIFNGVIPEKMHVCHTCDLPPCVNPDHLWIGTNQDNMKDKMIKGRHKGTKGRTWKKVKVD